VGNAKRASIPDLFKFFSAQIRKGFDPTVGQQAVVARLAALTAKDRSPPALDTCNALQQWFIKQSMVTANRRDNDHFGTSVTPRESPRKRGNKHLLCWTGFVVAAPSLPTT
jgi:hypothetical protein